ncbi:uncharacterized protein LOC127453140 [Myxocyprinus asiaticus]|uniref:uncharacterized protein LOC127453140 n=1 Tax=Myxocyprinus asiaticus TaxID=70543 RepID=UPI0022227E51|nr:uncharacterized protein LOC127453140 [Myxocyprinus asiaticus]
MQSFHIHKLYVKISFTFIPYRILKKTTSLNMAVNSTTGFFSSCTSHSESNCSGDVFYECMDSYPSNVLTTFSVLLNAILMLPLNCWILWLARRTTGAASSDFVILNQCVAEVIGNSCIIIFVLGAMLNKKALTLISSYMCSIFTVGRPLFQTFFCVERYLAVVHPLVYLRYIKALKIKLPFVGMVWLIILIFGWVIVDSYPKMPNWFYIGLCLAMLVVCITCSAMILWVLKKPRPGDREKEGSYQLKRKAFVAITVILITLLFGYGTAACVFALRDQLPYHTYCLALSLGWWILIPSGAVQPYLYLSKIDKLPCVKNL